MCTRMQDMAADDFVRIGAEGTIRPVGEPVGAGLSQEAAEAMGLSQGVAVSVGIIDAHAGAIGILGAGKSQGDVNQSLAMICGTSSW